MAEIIDLPVVTTLDTSPDSVIDAASSAGLTEVVIVGFTEAGELYFASSKADAGDVIWHLEMAKFRLLQVCEGDM